MSDIDKSLSKAELEEKNGVRIEPPEMDRIPSEIFSAIASLSDAGSQAERLARRRDAIKMLLNQFSDNLNPVTGWTIYDAIAVQAWKEGILPPKRERGRQHGLKMDAVYENMKRLWVRLEYKKLGEAHPKLTGEQRLEEIAKRLGASTAILNELADLIHASDKSAYLMEPERDDIVEMWFEWEADLQREANRQNSKQLPSKTGG